MFSTIKNKLYNKVYSNKLKKLYKDHINKYNLLLDNENKYKQENLEDDIRYLKLRANENLKLDLIDSFNMLRDNIDLDIISSGDFYKLEKIKDAAGKVIKIRRDIITHININVVFTTEIEDIHIELKQRKFILPENIKRLIFPDFYNNLEKSGLKSHFIRALLKRQADINQKTFSEILVKLGINRDLNFNNYKNIIVFYIYCEFFRYKNSVNPLLMNDYFEPHEISIIGEIAKNIV